ncbi:type I restriction endonuclease subunit R [Nostoc sp. FACHB-152]|uniref:type I restriction endonuclease n=1 Tax=unclassified Nostoc TaxID=2593658 RepID=UPI001689F973|nr:MULTISPECIES: type I restriction endonuclease [unclassified Nostoc]MBD2448524.1 type I restriction endonuclease subunit R [Nostoc sp. FACHB-152]MBD2466261.1 type I restriction endonuclease subunit R [Nostoc sp. FACHB-145]
MKAGHKLKIKSLTRSNPIKSTRTRKKVGNFAKKLRPNWNWKPSNTVDSVLTWFEVIGYTVELETDIASGRHQTERNNQTEVILSSRLRHALQRINPTISSEALQEAIRQLTVLPNSSLIENNLYFHRLLTQGIDITYIIDNQIIIEKVWLIDSSNLLNNDWLVIHPFTINTDNHTHHLDAVIFINGLPLALLYNQLEAKTTTFKKAQASWQQYIQNIPKLFFYNAFLLITYGKRAGIGTLTSNSKDFLPWHTIDGEDFPHSQETEIDVLIQGIFDKRRFLELIKHSIVFEENGVSRSKKLLRYHFCTVQ